MCVCVCVGLCVCVLILHDDIFIVICQEMHDQEVEHKAAFDKLMASQRVRPTVLLPLWNIAGFALGQVFCLYGVLASVHACVCAHTLCVCMCVCVHACVS